MVITFLVNSDLQFFKWQPFSYFSLICSHIHIDSNRNFIFGMNMQHDVEVPNERQQSMYILPQTIISKHGREF